MANHKTKLELTWIGKENQPRLEPRILIEDPAKSNHAPVRTGLIEKWGRSLNRLVVSLRSGFADSLQRKS